MTDRRPRILAIGEIIWDVYGEEAVIGGAPLNFAVHAHRCGADSCLLSAVGGDALGEKARKTITDFGLDDRYVQTNACPTGQCLVTLDESRVPRYEVLRNVAYDALVVDEALLCQLRAEDCDALYFGTLIQRDARSRLAVRRIVEALSESLIFCDVNLRPDCYDVDSVRFCLEHASVLKVSEEEEPILRQLGFYSVQAEEPIAIARALCERFPGLRVVVFTRGKDGSFAYDRESERTYEQEAIGDRVVSTVGAGDSFSAAWLTGYLCGLPMEMCLKQGASLSGFVVGHKEAIPDEK